MTPFDGKSAMEDETDLEVADREISLSPGIILGVFVALALVCAVFFGFGYSVGRRSAPAVVATVTDPNADIDAPKLSPANASTAARRAKESAAAPDAYSGEIAQPDSITESHAVKPLSRRTTSAPTSDATAPESPTHDSSAERSTVIFRAPAVVSPAASSAASSGALGAGSIVQVAAFSHEQDADLVAGALRKRGYDVRVRQQPQDNLLHVQLGPFSSKKEADAMRQRLQADGYNAIVK